MPFLSPLVKPGKILALLGHPIEDGFEYGVGIDAFGLAFEVQNDPMPQGREDNMPDIFGSDFGTPAEQRPDFAADNQGLSTTGARSISQILFRLFVSEGSRWLRGHDDTDSVVLNGFGDRHGQRDFAKLKNLFGVPHT